MLYEDEVVSPADLDVPTTDSVAPSKREVDMAAALVESLSSPFDPGKYHDEHREKVMAMIEAKAEGQVVAPTVATEAAAPVVDLMAALEASLAAAKERQTSKSA
jgi:DNA end-binding protein Ku